MLASKDICPEFEGETELPEDYPIYGGYFYVFSSECGKYQNAVWEMEIYNNYQQRRHLIHNIESVLKQYYKINIKVFSRVDEVFGWIFG